MLKNVVFDHKFLEDLRRKSFKGDNPRENYFPSSIIIYDNIGTLNYASERGQRLECMEFTNIEPYRKGPLMGDLEIDYSVVDLSSEDDDNRTGLTGYIPRKCFRSTAGKKGWIVSNPGFKINVLGEGVYAEEAAYLWPSLNEETPHNSWPVINLASWHMKKLLDIAVDAVEMHPTHQDSPINHLKEGYWLLFSPKKSFIYQDEPQPQVAYGSGDEEKQNPFQELFIGRYGGTDREIDGFLRLDPILQFKPWASAGVRYTERFFGVHTSGLVRLKNQYWHLSDMVPILQGPDQIKDYLKQEIVGWRTFVNQIVPSDEIREVRACYQNLERNLR